MSMRTVQSVNLLTSAIVTGAGESHKPWNPFRAFQVIHSTSAGAGAASVKIQVSNNNSNWIDMAVWTLTLSTTPTSEGFASDAPWKHVRANVISISGTDASVTVIMSSEGE